MNKTPDTSTTDTQSEKNFDQHTSEAIDASRISDTARIARDLELQRQARSAAREQAQSESGFHAVVEAVKKYPKTSIASAAALALGVAGVATISQPGGHETAPENAEIATNVFSIELAQDALWRNDPLVKEGDDGNNIVMVVKNPGELIGEARLNVVRDTDNGTWYGANPDWILDSPIANGLTEDQINALKSDKDGLVWVNEQGISKINYIDIQLPTTSGDQSNTASGK